ncbi:MAG: LLM class F420-dependent oxidoreductase [Pseudonocardia sp.]
MIFLTDYGIDGRTLARAVEERGFDGLFLTEHTHIPVRAPTPGGQELPRQYSHTYDPFVSLAAMAAVTERITLGTAVSLVAQHDPIVLAKTVASLDRIAGGRVELGVGPGWNREEMAHHGVDPRTRTRRMLEHLAAMRAIWTEEEAEFHGEFVDFGPIWSWPKPVRIPPVLIGGEGPTVLDRVLSHGDGWMPRRIAREEVDALAGRVAELRRRAADAGRGPVTVTVFAAPADRGLLDAYARAGVDRVLFGLPDADEAEVLHTLDDLTALRA